MKRIILSAAELAARMAVALQDPNKMQYLMYENEQGELYFPAPSPTYQMGTMDSAGRFRLGSATGEVPTAEANSAAIQTGIGNLDDTVRAGNPLCSTAEGVITGIEEWFPITPVAVTADGAGNPPATEIIPLAVTNRLDIMLFVGVDTVSAANQYLFNFRANTAAPVAVIPPWADVEIPSAARGHHPDHTYGFRMTTPNDNENFGVADGANADWPNAATCIFTGFFRLI